MNVHVPVMLKEVLDTLITDPEGLYIDATFGGGGHSGKILDKISPAGQLHSFDRDLSAVEAGKTYLNKYPNFQIHHKKFSQVNEVCEANSALGVLLDLGMSSNQIADPERGFTYLENGVLDLRMNQTEGLSAYQYIATTSEEELVYGLSVYGELRYAKTVANRIKQDVLEQKSKKELVSWITSFAHSKGLHPPRYLSQVFQALRMMVNEEEQEIKLGLPAAWKCLKKGGRLVVISFHSVEDRWVKQFFVELEKSCICPPELFRCECGNNHKKLKRVFKKPQVPSAQELSINPRARSAKLRVGEKLQ